MKQKWTTQTMVYAAVLAALVCAVTFFRFPLFGSKIHFANAMCLLSGLLMGPLAGGLAAGSAVLGALEQGLPLGALYEVVLACLLLLAVPGRAVRRLAVWLTPDQSSTADPRAQRLVQSRLEHTAQAFHTLYDALRSAFRPPENDNDTAAVYDRTASRVCRSCSLRDRCWKQDYNTTFNALNDATAAMVDRGRAESGDFP